MKAYLGMVLQKPKSRSSQLTPETPMRRRGIMAALTPCEAALIYMGWRSILPVTSGMLLVNASRASASPVKEQHLWALSYHFKEHRHMPQLYSAAEKKTACEWIPVVSRASAGAHTSNPPGLCCKWLPLPFPCSYPMTRDRILLYCSPAAWQRPGTKKLSARLALTCIICFSAPVNCLLLSPAFLWFILKSRCVSIFV